MGEETTIDRQRGVETVGGGGAGWDVAPLHITYMCCEIQLNAFILKMHSSKTSRSGFGKADVK